MKVETACMTEPERWTGERPDREAIAACRSCRLRRSCAQDAITNPRATGTWAGVFLPINQYRQKRVQEREEAFYKLRVIAGVINPEEDHAQHTATVDRRRAG